LLDAKDAEELAEDEVARSCLAPKASAELKVRLKSIASYEDACAVLEEMFDWICYLSTHTVGRPITAATLAQEPRVRELARTLPAKLRAADQALTAAPLVVQQLFADLTKGFSGVRDAETLFEAVLERHEHVQKEKPPEGKRSWFERSADGATFVRPPYRVAERPTGDRGWNRPYRIGTVLSFLDDLKVAIHEPA
jgi:hypothetical protein